MINSITGLSEREEIARGCWVLQRNNSPHAVYLNADEAQSELISKRASEMKWREENIHVADVRTYWNIFEVPAADAIIARRGSEVERLRSELEVCTVAIERLLDIRGTTNIVRGSAWHQAKAAILSARAALTPSESQ